MNERKTNGKNGIQMSAFGTLGASKITENNKLKFQTTLTTE